MTHLSVRLPENIADELKAFAARMRMPVGRALTMILDESLRATKHPGIDFRMTPTGRTAFVTGTGLAVWELVRIWSDHQQSIGKILRNYPHLTAAQVAAAVGYSRAYADEIAEDAQRAQPAAPLEEFPFLRPVRG